MAIGFAQARHLAARAGLGCPEAALVDRLAGLDRAQAVEAVLSQASTQAVTPPPDWSEQAPPGPLERQAMEKRQAQMQRRERAMELKQWWYRELLDSPSPLTERMTLFWHNHFTSSLRKVKRPSLLYHQNALLRRHALGSFAQLLQEVARDPAMVLYLDNQSNDQASPNENFARELLELFTLGEGHYEERDIKEAARAFTGWRVRRSTGRFHFAPHRHDAGTKVFLGRSGAWGGEDILRILLEQERTAQFIIEKMWRAFVSPEVDKKEVARIAADFARGGYQIKGALRALLRSDAFWSPQARGALIKSPVELTVGTARALGLSVKDCEVLVRAGRQLGQDLFDPPNVKGWPGGADWITSHTLLVRQRVLREAARRRFPRGEGLEGWLGRGAQPQGAAKLLLALAPVTPQRKAGGDARAVVSSLLLDPVFQLK